MPLLCLMTITHGNKQFIIHEVFQMDKENDKQIMKDYFEEIVKKWINEIDYKQTFFKKDNFTVFVNKYKWP